MSTKTERITILTTPEFKARLEHEAQLQNISVGKLIRNRFERDGSSKRIPTMRYWLLWSPKSTTRRSVHNTRSTKAWMKLRRRLGTAPVSAIKDAIAAMKEVLLLTDKVERAGTLLSDVSRELREHDRRLTRLETLVEFSSGRAGIRELPGPTMTIDSPVSFYRASRVGQGHGLVRRPDIAGRGGVLLLVSPEGAFVMEHCPECGRPVRISMRSGRRYWTCTGRYQSPSCSFEKAIPDDERLATELIAKASMQSRDNGDQLARTRRSTGATPVVSTKVVDESLYLSGPERDVLRQAAGILRRLGDAAEVAKRKKAMGEGRSPSDAAP